MNKRKGFYYVRCNESILKEMIRYENNELISKSEPICNPVWIDTDLQEFYTTYLFKVSGVPITGRWASFGILNVKYFRQ